MINTLKDYICRSLPEWGDFVTNPNLRKKVDEVGALLPYAGNTVVFLLDEGTKEKLGQLRDSLYQAAGDMLARPLQSATFHMTLHDLANGMPDQPGLYEHMSRTQQQAARLLPGWKSAAPLHMKTTWLFNMVNTSIVLGLEPADGASWQRLDGMYTELESVVQLGYALTPHITMAYFRPGAYTQEQTRRLAGALKSVDMDISLQMEALVLQNFTDMNCYETVL